MRSDRKWQARSRELLHRIDEIDQQRGSQTEEARLLLDRERKQVCREFAQFLRAVETDFGQTVYFSDDGRIVSASIYIDGVPRKDERDRANDWLKQRGIEWDGSAPSLRHAVRAAIDEGEEFPLNIFGLQSGWTISIAGPSKHNLELKAVSEALLDTIEASNQR